MERRTVTARLASGKVVTMIEPLIHADEAIATNYTRNQIGQGHLQKLQRDLYASTIFEIDGKPIDQMMFDARSTFKKLSEWTQIEKIYNRLLGKDQLTAVLSTIEEEAEEVTIEISDGRKVTLRQMTVDDDERIETGGNYDEHAWLRLVHDKVATGVIAIDGREISPGSIDLRKVIPLSRDWTLLNAVSGRINRMEGGSEPDFLDCPPVSSASTERSLSSAGMGINRPLSSSVAIPPQGNGESSFTSPPS